jgi:hypothetical protein
LGGINRRKQSRLASPETPNPIQKIIKAKRVRSMAQVVEHLIGKLKP